MGSGSRGTGQVGGRLRVIAALCYTLRRNGSDNLAGRSDMPNKTVLTREVTSQELDILETMAENEATDDSTRKRVRAILSFRETGSATKSQRETGIGAGTIRKAVRDFNEGGWQNLLVIQSPRGGDFLFRYDLGYWAERLVLACLDEDRDYRAVPYGTSRSEPFSDFRSFRQYRIDDALLQVWSFGRRWKRPDIVTLPRTYLEQDKGNDRWTPDLKLWDNERCTPYLSQAGAAIEVETSLWQVQVAVAANVSLSFTVKDEDLESLRAWVRHHHTPLYIAQVFYDQAYVLPFARLEMLIGDEAPEGRRVIAEVDPTTRKATYKIPLSEGKLLGEITEPEVEGRIYKAPNGKVTVYGRLSPTSITKIDTDVVSGLVNGILS